MRIMCVDYSEFYHALTVVFMNGTFKHYKNIDNKLHAWVILQTLN